jgi:hypothetical protein
MLQGLQDLKTKQTVTSKSLLAQTITDFSSAASSDASALDFYIEAVRVTQFVGQPHEQTAFREWKKKEIPKLSGPAIRAALRYTTISLQRSAGATDSQIFPVLLDYAQDTGSMLSSISDQPIVKQSVTGNIFARWYNIGEQLSGLANGGSSPGKVDSIDNWESSPGNVDQIYQKFLLPYMRKNRDPRLIQYWDQKISDETAAASSATAAFSTDRFNQTRRPQLLWSRAEDLIVINQRNQALSEMYTIVKNFPTHPDAAKWIDELQGLLTAPAVSATTTAPAPAQ